jgi:hypothetical protein
LKADGSIYKYGKWQETLVFAYLLSSTGNIFYLALHYSRILILEK